MVLRIASRFFPILFLLSAAVADTPKNATPISKQTRVQLVRLLSSEFVFVRKYFPMGNKGLVLRSDGTFASSDNEVRMLSAKKGTAVRPGQRAQITNVEFRDKAIYFELNGGPVKKRKWYQRIEISGAGGSTPIADQPNENAKGSSLTLQFKDKVPDLTLPELKEILKPVFDFTVKSAAQAYVESLPENVRKAIGDHQVLVGMNREMVQYSKGRPPQRVRERDDQSNEYEEWIYGKPPEDVEFVRFTGDEVVQVKVLKISGEKIVKSEKEVFLEGPNPMAVPDDGTKATAKEAPSKPAKPPTLRRPGETPPPDPNPPNNYFRDSGR